MHESRAKGKKKGVAACQGNRAIIRTKAKLRTKAEKQQARPIAQGKRNYQQQEQKHKKQKQKQQQKQEPTSTLEDKQEQQAVCSSIHTSKTSFAVGAVCWDNWLKLTYYS